MKPGYYDDRVGYFTTQTITDFDMNPQIDPVQIYCPLSFGTGKPEDVEKYKRGELVEPQKQIVYYIDPTTPKNGFPI